MCTSDPPGYLMIKPTCSRVIVVGRSGSRAMGFWKGTTSISLGFSASAHDKLSKEFDVLSTVFVPVLWPLDVKPQLTKRDIQRCKVLNGLIDLPCRRQGGIRKMVEVDVRKATRPCVLDGGRCS